MYAPVHHPDDLSDGRLRRLFEMWAAAAKAAAKTGGIPPKSFAEPIALHFLLGSLVLFEVERDPLRFRYRLFGSDLGNQLGIERTGSYADKTQDQAAGIKVTCLLADVATEGRPYLATAERTILGMTWPTEALALPLADSQGIIAFVLAAQVFGPNAPNQRFLLSIRSRVSDHDD
jgi:hypothetical protein